MGPVGCRANASSRGRRLLHEQPRTFQPRDVTSLRQVLIHTFTHPPTSPLFISKQLFRAIPRFLVQWGVSLDEATEQRWRDRPPIPDDDPRRRPFTRGFKRGMISFAGNEEHSRTTQLFIAFSENDRLGESPWESPIGVVKEDGMERLDRITMYGDVPEFGGTGPDPGRLASPKEARTYLQTQFPKMDYIRHCRADLPLSDGGSLCYVCQCANCGGILDRSERAKCEACARSAENPQDAGRMAS